MEFSNKTEQLLLNAGWSHNRKIDISEFEKVLNEEGYVLDNNMREFLSRFGGLKVVHPHAKVPQSMDYFVIDPILATTIIEKEIINNYEKRVGENLVCIGMAFRNYMVLLLSESGKVYAGYDGFLILCGNDYFKAFETICEGKDAIEIEPRFSR